VWQREGLEAQADAVLAWIAAGRATADWQRDGGAYVPGMQVWLHGRDFSEPPPDPVPVRIDPQPSRYRTLAERNAEACRIALERMDRGEA